MALKFTNIRSRETRTAKTEPQISALYNSSNLSPNVQQGQDFGWRLAPEVVVEMRRIKKNQRTMDHIAAKYNIPTDNVTDTTILQFISDRNSQKGTPEEDQDFSQEYEDEIRQLDSEDKTPEDKPEEDAPETPRKPNFNTVAGFEFEGNSYAYQEATDGTEVRYLKGDEEITGEDFAAAKEASTAPAPQTVPKADQSKDDTDQGNTDEEAGKQPEEDAKPNEDKPEGTDDGDQPTPPENEENGADELQSTNDGGDKTPEEDAKDEPEPQQPSQNQTLQQVSEDMPVPQLQAIATDEGVEDASKLESAEELVKAINEKRAGKSS